MLASVVSYLETPYDGSAQYEHQPFIRLFIRQTSLPLRAHLRRGFRGRCNTVGLDGGRRSLGQRVGGTGPGFLGWRAASSIWMSV